MGKLTKNQQDLADHSRQRIFNNLKPKVVPNITKSVVITSTADFEFSKPIQFFYDESNISNSGIEVSSKPEQSKT